MGTQARFKVTCTCDHHFSVATNSRLGVLCQAHHMAGHLEELVVPTEHCPHCKEELTARAQRVIEHHRQHAATGR